MNVELTRFRVRAGAEPVAEEWMTFLRDNRDAVLETLEPERMYVETIFSEVLDGVMYLYWYSVQGEGAALVQESEHWLDKKHVEYWRACIDDAHPPVDLTCQAFMVPDRALAAMSPIDG